MLLEGFPESRSFLGKRLPQPRARWGVNHGAHPLPPAHETRNTEWVRVRDPRYLIRAQHPPPARGLAETWAHGPRRPIRGFARFTKVEAGKGESSSLRPQLTDVGWGFQRWSVGSFEENLPENNANTQKAQGQRDGVTGLQSHGSAPGSSSAWSHTCYLC